MKLLNTHPDRSHHHENGSHPAAGDDTITREMVCARTLELTSRAGRKPHQIRQSDYEKAKWELKTESKSARRQAMFDS